MRLDFDTFTITGPSTLKATSVAVIGGNVVGATATHSGATQCSTDLFSGEHITHLHTSDIVTFETDITET